VVVLVILFGARRLPGAAQSLGQSMHIFRKSVQGLHGDDTDSAANLFGATSPTVTASPFTAAPPPAVAAPDATQQQLQDLQRQVQDLQRQTANGTGQASEAQTSQQI
jgi:Sec-independent protein translocase protein TatA